MATGSINKLTDSTINKAFIFSTYTSNTISVAANGSTFGDATISIPDGYSFGFCQVEDTGAAGIIPRSCRKVEAAKIRAYVDNRTGNAISTSLTIRVCYIKTDMI